MTAPAAPDNPPTHYRGIQQSRHGYWWVDCCWRIITRHRLDDCECWTRADAEALADWHEAGENGPPPTSEGPGQLDLFTTL